jgi:hypothetical protein
MAERQVSPERKGIYYLGMGLSGLGALVFMSTFLTAAMSFGDFTNFHERGRSMAVRSVVGMSMMIVGGGLMTVGRAGLAGSGVMLDPERSRRDVEPWSRATGGMISDALDEAGIQLGGGSSGDADMPFDEKLRRLHKLFEDGILSEDEYQREKTDILRDK